MDVVDVFDCLSIMHTKGTIMEYVADNSKLMREWLSVKNAELGLEPENLVVGSRKKARWKCSVCGHEWLTYIYVRQKHGCPKCGFKKLSEERSCIPHNGKTIIDVFPDVVKCWNYEKNGDLRPDNMAAMSNKKVWWKCSECGREWQSSISNRSKRNKLRCRNCNLRKTKR